MVTQAQTQLDKPYPNRFLSFGKLQGFPEEFVYCAAQDKHGIMWFGTAGGLYRYDGARFTVYNFQENIAGINPNRFTSYLYYDEKFDELWVLGFEFFYRLNVNTLQPILPKIDSEIFKSYKSNNFLCATRFGNNLILGCNNGIGVYNRSTDMVEWRNLDTVLQSTRIIGFVPNNKTNSMLVLSNYNVLEIDQTLQIKNQYPNQKKYFFSQIAVEPETDKLWASSLGHGMLIFNKQLKKWEEFPLQYKQEKINYVTTFHFHNHKLAFSYGPMFYYDFTTKELKKVENNTGEYNFTKSKIVHIFTDKSGNIWYSSHAGLCMASAENYEWHEHPLLDKTTGWNMEVLHTSYHAPYMLISNTTTSGLALFNIQTRQLEVIPSGTGNITYTAVDKNQIFACTKKQIYRLLLPEKKLTPIGLIPGNLDTDFSKIIVVNKDKLILLNSDNKTSYYFNPNTKIIQPIQLKQFGKLQANEFPEAHCVDAQENIWYSGVGRIFKQNKNGEIKMISLPKEFKNVLVNSIATYQKHVFAGTISQGFFEIADINKNTNWENYQTNSTQDLSSNNAYRLQTNAAGKLIISSLNGILIWDIEQKKQIGEYNKRNGLYQDNLSYSIYCSADGFIATSMYAIAQWGYPIPSKTNLTCFISGLMNAGIKVTEKSIFSDIQDIHLDFQKPDLWVQLGASGYSHPDLLVWYYKMDEQQEWIKIGNKAELLLSGLGSGEHFVQFKCKDYLGNESKGKVGLNIFVSSPFYKTWWFILLISMLIFGSIWYYFYLRKKHFTAEEKLKTEFNKQLADAEMKALRAQMNPHFIFNTLNSINKFILNNESKKASQYLTKFAKLIRLILDGSAQGNITLENEIQLIHLYLEMEKLRFENGFDYHIETAENMSLSSLHIPAMVVQPHLENAVWHGLLHKDGDSKLTIKIQEVNADSFQIIVLDNGIGRVKSKELQSANVTKRKSYGTKITEDRIKLYAQMNHLDIHIETTDLYSENREARGTQVTITLPKVTANYESTIGG